VICACKSIRMRKRYALNTASPVRSSDCVVAADAGEPSQCTSFRFWWLGSPTRGWKPVAHNSQPSRNYTLRRRACRYVEVVVDRKMRRRPQHPLPISSRRCRQAVSLTLLSRIAMSLQFMPKGPPVKSPSGAFVVRWSAGAMQKGEVAVGVVHGLALCLRGSNLEDSSARREERGGSPPASPGVRRTLKSANTMRRIHGARGCCRGYQLFFQFKHFYLMDLATFVAACKCASSPTECPCPCQPE
jgi:hypothetical protein